MSRRFVLHSVFGSILEGFRSDSTEKKHQSQNIDGSLDETRDSLPDRLVNQKHTTPFEYDQLSSSPDAMVGRQIRLLRLLPGTRQDDIEASLITANLHSSLGQFEALSYVWGAVSDHTPIQVNGYSLDIGLNLRSALLNLRSRNTARMLWVDAICIDQNNVKERERQIVFMGDIFAAASQTIVWLGDSGVDTAEAFSTIREIGTAAIETDRQSVQAGKGELFDKYKNDTSIDNAIMASPWWLRVWTVQEILLAKKAVIVSGKFQVDWDFFCKAAIFGEALEIWETVFMGNTFDSTFIDLHALKSLQTTSEDYGPAGKLLHYLVHTRRRQAIDLRDKIYGVLGLVPGAVDQLGIEPNYQLSIEEVFQDATRKILEKSNSLDALGACNSGGTNDAGGTPSWVADWVSSKAVARPLMNDAKGKQRKTHAANDTKASPKWVDHGQTLVLEGHILDTVVAVSHVLPEVDSSEWDDDVDVDDPDQSLLEILRDLKTMASQAYRNLTRLTPMLGVFIEWETFAKALKPTNPDARSSDPMDIYWQTLCTGSLAPDGGYDKTKTLFAEWMGTLSPIRSLKQWGFEARAAGMFRLGGFLGYLKSTWNGYGEFGEYTTQATERRIGSTRKGYLALLPRKTEPHDQIWILKGGRVPIVLRPRSDDAYTLLGEAFAHGFMNGEAFNENAIFEVRIK